MAPPPNISCTMRHVRGRGSTGIRRGSRRWCCSARLTAKIETRRWWLKEDFCSFVVPDLRCPTHKYWAQMEWEWNQLELEEAAAAARGPPVFTQEELDEWDNDDQPGDNTISPDMPTTDTSDTTDGDCTAASVVPPQPNSSTVANNNKTTIEEEEDSPLIADFGNKKDIIITADLDRADDDNICDHNCSMEAPAVLTDNLETVTAARVEHGGEQADNCQVVSQDTCNKFAVMQQASETVKNNDLYTPQSTTTPAHATFSESYDSSSPSTASSSDDDNDDSSLPPTSLVVCVVDEHDHTQTDVECASSTDDVHDAPSPSPSLSCCSPPCGCSGVGRRNNNSLLPEDQPNGNNNMTTTHKSHNHNPDTSHFEPSSAASPTTLTHNNNSSNKQEPEDGQQTTSSSVAPITPSSSSSSLSLLSESSDSPKSASSSSYCFVSI
eukprot:TRINITY_DN67367_c7_g3_i2.p1 TRINITY_DN67367_c7_g3~~TRINITY_DN67367_c7_g3_i2.p1  ORF type:complete len:438 (+),score=107.61 TRINITY_DN67367_c7_g3_i2:709-2022(+)